MVTLPAKGPHIFAVHRRDARQLFGLLDRHFERRVVEIIRRRRSASLVDPHRDGRDRVLAAAAGGKPVGGEAQVREVLAIDPDFRVSGFRISEQLLANRLRFFFSQQHGVPTDWTGGMSYTRFPLTPAFSLSERENGPPVLDHTRAAVCRTTTVG